MEKKQSPAILTTMFILILACILFIAAMAFAGYQHIIKDKSVNKKNIQLEAEVSSMQKSIDTLSNHIDTLNDRIYNLENPSNEAYNDKAFNYLAIGNSITKHGLTDYWWNDIGMAASKPEKDFFHIICDHLKKKHKETKCYAVNYYAWESLSKDRAETFEIIDNYLDPRLNLVTLQLGENAIDLSTFESDFAELIRHIQEKAPKAQIIVVDDFWDNPKRAKFKKNACKTTGVKFISLKKIKGKKKYQCGMGTVVYDAEGGSHKVKHKGVSVHPGDKGMAYIAKSIIKHIK